MCIDQLKNYLEISQSVFTTLAILIGGWWTWRNFIRNRLKFPKVRLNHSIYQFPIDEEHRMIRVTLRLDNQSNVLIKPGKITMRLQQVKPWPAEILNENVMLQESESYYKWPLIVERETESVKVEIEPNEIDEYPFDFVIDSRYSTIAVYSYVQNKMKRRIGLGWTLTTVFEMEVYKNG